jgi:hypothetical protein
MWWVFKSIQICIIEYESSTLLGVHIPKKVARMIQNYIHMVGIMIILLDLYLIDLKVFFFPESNIPR